MTLTIADLATFSASEAQSSVEAAYGRAFVELSSTPIVSATWSGQSMAAFVSVGSRAAPELSEAALACASSDGLVMMIRSDGVAQTRGFAEDKKDGGAVVEGCMTLRVDISVGVWTSVAGVGSLAP